MLMNPLCYRLSLRQAPADAQARRAPLSVVGSMRPDDLMAALADGNDSFAARFLYAWPDPPPYCRLVERRRPSGPASRT
jgi:hypothetical protein